MAKAPMTIDVRGERVGILGDPAGDLLLLPGAGGGTQVFARLIERLPRAFAIDLPGHGESAGQGLEDIGAYARWLSRILEDLGLTPSILGGHSMGGAIALHLALDGPYAPKGLCLIASGGRLRVHPDLLAGLRSGAIPEVFRAAMVGRGHPESLVDQAVNAPAPVALADFLACDRFDVLDRLPEIAVPLLAVVGDEDRYTPVKYARSVVDATQGTLEVIPGSGHLLPLEAPDALARVLTDWLSEG